MSTRTTLKWLIKRELWEHKGALIWAPILMAAMMVLIAIISRMVAFVRGEALMIGGIAPRLNPKGTEHFDALADYAFRAPLMTVAVVLALSLIFYCIGTLFDDRRDRSVLFWKSLPISDRLTVLSKVIVAVLIAPSIALIAALTSAFFVGLITCTVLATQGVNIFGDVLRDPRALSTPLALLAMLPVHAVWSLPTVAWLMMVSAWARSKPLLWAFGGPILLAVLYSYARLSEPSSRSTWIWDGIVIRLLGGVMPGLWRDYAATPANASKGVASKLTDSDALSRAWSLFAQPDMWFGALAGVVMLGVAVWLRRRNEES